MWQPPYLANGAMADQQKGYMNTLASAYGPGNSASACAAPACAAGGLSKVPCGYGGVVTNCPKNSMMDWWVTGWQNSIYAVNGGSLWPYLEDTYPDCNCYEYAPKLLGCCPSQTGPTSGLMTFPGLQGAQDGPGVSIALGYGFNAEAAARANMGIGNYSRMQKQSPPRSVQEPCAGSWIR